MGHEQYNLIQLKALSSLGTVYTIFREKYYLDLDIPNVCRYMDIPNKYFLPYSSTFKSRWLQIIMMRFLQKNIYLNDWDNIILSSSDVIVLALSNTFKNAICIGHSLGADMNNIIKVFFTKSFNHSLTHVVFNNLMKDRINQFGIHNVKIVPHGFQPFVKRDFSTCETVIRNKYNINESVKYLFIPSISSCSENLFDYYFYNEIFNNYLYNHHLLLITKINFKREAMSNMRFINGYLPQEDYEYLFLHSICNVLVYSETFNYRVSGVLNECFANKVPCIINNNLALEAYNNYFNEEIFVYSNVEQLMNCIDNVLNLDMSMPYYKNLEDISDPTSAWKRLLEGQDS